MSTLTRIFVILLVVVSLLSAAGFVVFVNEVQNFKVALATSTAQRDQMTAAVTSAKVEAGRVQTLLDTATKERDDATRENTRLANENADKVASLQATIASDASQSRVAAVSLENVTAALTASEGQRKGVGDALAAERTKTDGLQKTLFEDEVAINDLTRRNDVSGRKVTDLSEQLAQFKSENDAYLKQLKELGVTPGASSGQISLSAPPINGVVRTTGETNGIPYATISVGSAEQVAKGMVFQVVDRTHGGFLGELTINAVDLHEATGKLEGPGIGQVRAGTTEVKTQL